MKKLTMVYVNTEEGSVKTIQENDPQLEDLYRLLHCDLIDIVSRKIGKHVYSIICDDEGLFRLNPMVSMIEKGTGRTMLVGSLLVTRYNEAGKNVGLTEKQAKEITDNVVIGWHPKQDAEGNVRMYTYEILEGSF